jgi:hypothetical protein
MNDLVDRLTKEQEVEISHRPDVTLEAFSAAIERGYVHVRFPGTRGGTELGVKVRREQSDFTTADFEHGTGSAFIVGELTLNYVPVRLQARINLPELRGTGKLEPITS